MLNPVSGPEITQEDCTGCGDCVPVCPTDGLKVVDDKVALAPYADCTYCAECEEVCPSNAIACPYEIVMAENQGQ